jgi:hypothetical protein
LEHFEIDVLGGFALPRASAGVRDPTIRGELGQLQRVREWFGGVLYEMEPLGGGQERALERLKGLV